MKQIDSNKPQDDPKRPEDTKRQDRTNDPDDKNQQDATEHSRRSQKRAGPPRGSVIGGPNGIFSDIFKNVSMPGDNP